MPVVRALSDLAFSPTAALYQGRGDGFELSCFVTDTPPGKGPGLHVHPYPEVFVVTTGQALFTVGDEQVTVPGGHVVVAPAETPHGFKNSGDAPLQVVSFHPNGEVIQTWLEE
jgi:mannose-6-phosphate isomerase-like protein (cupin superfamily)